MIYVVRVWGSCQNASQGIVYATWPSPPPTAALYRVKTKNLANIVFTFYPGATLLPETIFLLLARNKFKYTQSKRVDPHL